MSIATDLWFRNLRQNKPSGARKPQRIDEISEYGLEETYTFMADNGPRIQTEFDDIFDGAMRKVIPLNDSDTQKIIEVVKELKSDGLHPPYVNSGPAVAFPTKIVKQKRKRLADQGGGTFYQDVRVASFDLVKELDYEIPAGPRKGETIKKTKKTTMSRAIANAVKFKRMRPELLDWWRKKQTFYTKNEDSYNLIENAFEGAVDGEDLSIILSRHPVDVLRMSDLPAMSSCHSEHNSHFKCAVAESKGNGLIAYLVKTSELDSFLRTAPGEEVDLQHHAEEALWRFLAHKDRLDAGHRSLNDTRLLNVFLGMVQRDIRAWEWRSKSRGRPWDGRDVAETITIDMLRDAIHAKLENKPTWPDQDTLPPPNPIADYDRQEIFRDPERNVPGIGANSRVRMRKFFDSASGDWFTVPEDRLYGDEMADRFRTAVQEWAWEAQKYKFTDDDHLELPRASYLIRYGGSYEDTNDGPLLDKFFSMSGQDIKEYGYGNVRHDSADEEDLFEQAEEELEEVLNTARNRAEHVGFDAEVSGDEEPYTIGSAQVEFQFDIEWEGPMNDDHDTYVWPEEERDYATIPKAYGSAYDSRRFFASMLDNAFPIYSEDTSWEVRTIRSGGAHELTVRFHMNFEGTTPEEFDSFCDEMISDIDEDYDEIFQKIRRKLVQEDYLPPNDFDRLADDIVEQSNELKNWEVLGIDADDQIDADGEVWFNFKPLGVGVSASTMVYLPGKFPGLIGNTMEALRSVFGNLGEIDKRMVNPGVKFTNMLIEKSKPLVDAANGHVEQQLEFDFGDQYNRPSYEPIDFGHAVIRLNIDNNQDVYFTMKLVVEATQDEADIKGAFEYMKFIDQYPNQVIKVVTDTYETFLQNQIGVIKERERKMLDGTDMNSISQALELQMGDAANSGDQGAEQAMLVIMFIRQNWDKFSRFEKDASVNNYLRPMLIGSARPYGMWDNDGEKPNQWDGIIRAKMRGAKVPNANNYEWGGDWKPGPGIPAQLQNRMGMSPEESHEADNTLQGLSDEERSKAMDALVRGDREEFVRIIRGSVNEGRGSNRRADAEADEQQAARLRKKKPKRYDPSRYEHGGRNLSGADAIWAWKQIRKNYLETDEAAWDYIDKQPGTTDEQKVVAALGALKASETVDEQIDRVDRMLSEREPIDLRIYKVALGCVVDTQIAGTDSQIENQIRGIEEVTTVSHRADLERRVGQDAVYRVYEIKFELYGQQARDTYRDSVLVPSIEKEVVGATVRDRGLPELASAPLKEWGGLGYTAPPSDRYLPQMVTPRVSLDSVVEDWAEGGVQIYDTPMNTNQMQYHVMMPVEELWKVSSRYYRGTKADFDGRYKHFIKGGPQMPVYVALGQNGRARITGNEDLVWFAKKSGQEELPVFFSYQRQV
tara:strand:- start:10741 stop:14904 length:4164 start_codon:yes stop_codon:yes gene_type:complete